MTTTLLTLALAACRPPEPAPTPDDGGPHSATSTVPNPHSAPEPRHSAGPECTHTGLPAPDPDPAFADCPRFDWLVVMASTSATSATSCPSPTVTSSSPAPSRGSRRCPRTACEFTPVWGR